MSIRRDTALRWTAYVAVAIAFAIACVFLSNWQFARNGERAAQLALVERNYDADAVPLDEMLPSDQLDPESEWHPVVVVGEYVPEQQTVVRNRPHGGTSAFEVLTPLRTSDGRVLIVDRGWIPPAESGDGPSAIPAPPTGTVSVVVRLRAPEALPTSGRTAPAGQVPTINLPLVAETTGPTTLTSAYGVLVSESPAVAEMPYALDAPSEDPGPHLSYAVQWILFAVMGFVFIGYIIRTERRKRAEDDDETTPTASPVLRRPARVDRDAEQEDAILDRTDA
ncbi:SURF1 family protein [Microbacterium sp. CIAB417]|uniref:SURF1 family cytochrome oxidase biogenesis protein n=1 Tax=Microbacterium sp. CIAB417 TaxID=2860287 RepID=UPI0027E2B106|nr:SURF1 family protein [Microbacterium sp. CIAB417]